MALKDHPSVIVGTIVVAVAGLFWNIGSSMRNDRIAELETKLENYELSETLEAKELLSALGEASKELTSNLQVITELSSLRKENDALTGRTQELSKEIEDINDTSSKALQSLKDETNRKIAELMKDRDSIESQLEAERRPWPLSFCKMRVSRSILETQEDLASMI